MDRYHEKHHRSNRALAISTLIGLIFILAGCLPGARQQQPAVPAPLGADEPQDAQFELACTNRGGVYERDVDQVGSDGVCTFPDGSTCSYAANRAGEACLALTALAPDGSPAVTALPTKEGSPPVTPIVKEADPFAGLATYLNAGNDFGFRYADTWLVEDQPGLVRLTREGMELLVHYRPVGENTALEPSSPYQGEPVAGDPLTFFGAELQPQLMQIDGQVLAVQAGDPVKPLSGGGNEYLIELYSLQSDAPLSEQVLAEFYTLLGSFEPWTNN